MGGPAPAAAVAMTTGAAPKAFVRARVRARVAEARLEVATVLRNAVRRPLAAGADDDEEEGEEGDVRWERTVAQELPRAVATVGIREEEMIVWLRSPPSLLALHC